MSKTLIVYVHGALSSKDSWNYICQNLKKNFLSQIIEFEIKMPQEEFIQYDLNKETASNIVENMKDLIQQWVIEKSIQKIVLIGHSFGGVLSVQTVRELEDFFKINNVKSRLVTLSSPFAGSEIAIIFRMIKPNSLFFKNIGDHTDFIKNFKKYPLPCHSHIFITTAGGADWMPQANDGVVTIESQSFFNKDKNASVHEINSNHFEILLTDSVVDQLYKEVIYQD